MGAQPLTEAIVRRMRDADVPRVIEIENECYSTPWSEETFRGLLRRRDCDLYVADADATVVGYSVFWSVLDQGELGNVAITTEWRRRSLARLLIDRVFDGARTRGVREVFLEVRVSNDGARSLYTQLGFRQVGRRRDYYSAPIEDALVLCRTLDT